MLKINISIDTLKCLLYFIVLFRNFFLLYCILFNDKCFHLVKLNDSAGLVLIYCIS